MPGEHGLADWSSIKRAGPQFTMQDLAELAARLGSPVTFNRLGYVIEMDSFEDGLSRVFTDLSGTGAAVQLSRTAPRTGTYSALLRSGSTPTPWAQIFKHLAYPYLGRIGLEVSVRPTSAFNFVQLHLVVFDGTTRYQGILRYYYATSLLRYLNSGASYVTIDTLPQWPTALPPYHTLKLVVDFATAKHVRVIVDNEVYLLDGVAINSGASAEAAKLFGGVLLEGRSGVNDEMLADDMIITVNEP